MDALPTPTLLFLSLNLALPRPAEVQTLYAATHDALRETLLRRSAELESAGAEASFLLATVRSEQELEAYRAQLPERTLVFLTSNLELFAPKGTTLLRFSDIDPQESLLINLAPEHTYALSSKARGLSFDPFLSGYDAVQAYESVETLLLVEALVHVGFKQDSKLGESLERLLVTLLCIQADYYLEGATPEALADYLDLLRRLAERKDARDGRALIASERFAPLCRQVADAMDPNPTERETLYQAIELLDLAPTPSLINAPPREMSANLVLTLTRTLLNRHRLLAGVEAETPLAARIVRAVQDYLRQGEDVAALKALRERLPEYDERVFRALSRIERRGGAAYAMPTLQGEGTGEDLFGLLQMVQVTARSGALAFETQADGQRRRGWVSVEEGAVTGAEAEDLELEDALLEMFTWKRGKFFLYDLEAVLVKRLERRTDALLLMGVTYLDDVRALATQGFGPDVPARAVREGTPRRFASLFSVVQFYEHPTLKDLLARGYAKRWVLEGFAYLARERWIRFGLEAQPDAEVHPDAEPPVPRKQP